VKHQPGSHVTDRLLDRLALLPKTQRYWVGFSGGADSTALLQILHELGPRLEVRILAVHFNHQLQDQSADWQEHCQSFCKLRNIPLHVITLDLDNRKGMSPEELARVHRYAAVDKLLESNDVYLTAHHADDNAETLFINLMRGSGIDGLAGVPFSRKTGKGLVARPLLDCHRQELREYLRRRDIAWMEDPSNSDTKFDRNYLRTRVFPDLEQRWPGLVQRLNQTANHARSSTEVMSQLVGTQYVNLLKDAYILRLEPLLEISSALQAVVLRQWLRNRGALHPPRVRLNEFLAQINCRTHTRNKAELSWTDWRIKQQAEVLWLEELPGPGKCPTQAWPSGHEIVLEQKFGKIILEGKNPVPADGWVVGSRRPGMRISLKQGDPSRKLKELMRVSGIPSWLRHSIPILYWNDEIAAIGDWLLSAELERFLAENSITYKWLPGKPLLSKLQSVSVHKLGSTES
jgi:tRNA(Ile)-lysidine synthase